MIPNRYVGISRLHFAIQFGGSFLLFWLLFFGLNFGYYRGEISSPVHYVIACGLLLLSLFIEFSTRPHAERRMCGLERRELRALSHRQMVFSMATIFGFIVMTKDQTLSRLFLASFFLLDSIWITWANMVGFRMLSRKLYRTEERGRGSAILVGSGPEIDHFLGNPKAPAFPGIDLCGYVNVGPGTSNTAPLPELGKFQNLGEICRNTKAKALVLLGLQSRNDLIDPVLELSDSYGLRAMWIDNIDSRFGSRFVPFHTGKYTIISHIDEPLEDPVNRFIKRTFDLACSSIGILVVLPPAFLLVWILQRLNAPGPILYTQARTGRNGEPFKVYKFRSMYVNPEDENRQTQKNDSRIFPGGNLIRKSSIDELPQLLNVFKGEMSIVGPRPHAQFTDEEHADGTPSYRLRSLAKPGITGLAQCNGFRGDTSEPFQIRSRIRLDLFYVQKWSLNLDICIIAKTVIHLIKPHKTAY